MKKLLLLLCYFAEYLKEIFQSEIVSLETKSVHKARVL